MLYDRAKYHLAEDDGLESEETKSIPEFFEAIVKSVLGNQWIEKRLLWNANVGLAMPF